MRPVASAAVIGGLSLLAVLPTAAAVRVIGSTTVHPVVVEAAAALRAERALREAALWHEVEDRLNEPAATLSVGQQQRLCLARALAVEPEVILMDEPTSALDPRSTAAIEELILRLKARHAVVVVTHDLAQARRVSDRVACLTVRRGAGQVVETAGCEELFARPLRPETVQYLNRE